jgi:hypothetical protein
VAAHRSGRAPLRSDPGAAAGAESSAQLEADRREPRQARAKSRSALPGAAAVRLLAADPVARRATRAHPWADGSVRRRDGASTLRAVRARTARRRPCSRRRPDPTRVRERASQAHEDAAQQTRRPLQGIALEALDQLRAREDSPVLFPNADGGHLDFATSTGAIGSRSRRRPESTRCAISTTCATRTPPSPSAPAFRCSPCRDSWARASQ